MSRWRHGNRHHDYYGFPAYVPVAERRAKAARAVKKMFNDGKQIQPVAVAGRTIATTFWGRAWCDNLEAYSDFANRLPRGRTYVRNGSVVHLEVQAGQVKALVSGSELYKVNIAIAPATPTRWKSLCKECAGGIGSLVELLQGRFSDRVMSILTRQTAGLFPVPDEIKMTCSCPDWATMCKHVAAVLYGVGARLDQSPELLFLLRSVEHQELIARAAAATDIVASAAAGGPELTAEDVGAIFGIEMDPAAPPPSKRHAAPKTRRVAPAPKAAPPHKAPKLPKRQPAPKAKTKPPRKAPVKKAKRSVNRPSSP